MNLDFQAAMVLGLFVTGIVWGLDAWLWAPKRRLATTEAESAGADEEAILKVSKEPAVIEFSRSFFPIILAVLVLRSFIVEPFRIPSASMMPTLLIGDFILVNKFAYGLRLPVTETKIIDISDPERGDVVVFRYPKNPSIDYIKRVVGLPGDRIGYFNKILYINGKPMHQRVIGEYIGLGSGVSSTGSSLRDENLEGVHHEILLRPGRSMLQGEYVVPDGHYFMVGDNRDNSNDSRVWGFVPEENLVGKAFMIWMNWDSAKGGVDWARIGNAIE